MLYKNTASQKIAVFAYTASTGAAKTGDAAQITAYLSKDWGAAAAVTDTNPTEMDATNMPGWYVFDLTQAETNGNVLVFAPKSSTSGVVCDQVQVFTTASIDQTGDSYAIVNDGTFGLSALEALVDDLESRLTAVRAGYLDNLSGGAVALQASVDDLEGRLTATRAGYLDNLSAGAVALASGVAVASIATDAITAAAVKADAVTEIQAGLATAASIAALNNLSAAQVWQYVIETLTAEEIMTIALAVLAGKSNGGGTTTVHFRDYADSKNRVTATVDTDGNRTAMTLDPT